MGKYLRLNELQADESSIPHIDSLNSSEDPQQPTTVFWDSFQSLFSRVPAVIRPRDTPNFSTLEVQSKKNEHYIAHPSSIRNSAIINDATGDCDSTWDAELPNLLKEDGGTMMPTLSSVRQVDSLLTRRSNSSINENGLGPIVAERPSRKHKSVAQIAPKFQSNNLTKRFPEWVQRINPGILLMLLNSFLGSIVSLSVKLLSTLQYPTFQLVFTRSLILFSCTLIWQLCQRGPVSPLDVLVGIPGSRKLVFYRSTAGFLAISMYYLSVKYLSVGEATVISFTSPFFVGIAARIFLSEKWEVRIHHQNLKEFQ
jgi:hypothetical protein